VVCLPRIEMSIMSPEFVIKEFISIEKAREVYKVMIDPATLEIDTEKTALLRTQKNRKG
jgi:hypothetical protein